MQELIVFIKNHFVLVSLFALALIWLVVEESRRGQGGAKAVSPQELVQLMNHEQVVVIDIRSANLFLDGHIIAAVNMSEQQLMEEKTLKLYSDKTIVVVSSRGQGITLIAHKLLKLGVDIRVLTGGMQAWKQANLPVVKR